MIPKEAELVLRSSVINPTEKDIEKINEVISYDLDWGYFLYLCTHHRVIPLVWRTLSELNLINYVENHVRRVMKSAVNGIAFQNKAVFKEVERINELLYEKGIKTILLKGCNLAPFVYGDIALRQFGDIDILVRIEDIQTITKILEDEGYIQGFLDVNSTSVTPATREEKLFKRLNTHEIVEFIKLNPDINCPYFMIDINFSIIWRGSDNTKKVFDCSQLIESAQRKSIDSLSMYCISPEYQVVQLAAHLYSEAVFFCFHSNWYRDKSDLNLIKFCDINELIHSSKIDWDHLYELVKNLNMDEAVYYSLTLLKKLFPMSIPDTFLSRFEFDEDMTEYYFDKEGNKHKWTTDFFSRMFFMDKKIEEVKSKNIEIGR
jgi:hypothetical protein